MNAALVASQWQHRVWNSSLINTQHDAGQVRKRVFLSLWYDPTRILTKLEWSVLNPLRRLAVVLNWGEAKRHQQTRQVLIYALQQKYWFDLRRNRILLQCRLRDRCLSCFLLKPYLILNKVVSSKPFRKSDLSVRQVRFWVTWSRRKKQNNISWSIHSEILFTGKRIYSDVK